MASSSPTRSIQIERFHAASTPTIARNRNFKERHHLRQHDDFHEQNKEVFDWTSRKAMVKA